MDNVTDFLEQACGLLLFCFALSLCFEGFRLLEVLQEMFATRQMFWLFI